MPFREIHSACPLPRLLEREELRVQSAHLWRMMARLAGLGLLSAVLLAVVLLQHPHSRVELEDGNIDRSVFLLLKGLQSPL